MLALFIVLAVLVTVVLAVYVCSDKIPATKIQGKNVLITGGSSGIGLATAKEMIARGAASVAIVARSQPTLDKAKAELQALVKDNKTQVYAYSCDVSNDTDFNAMFEKHAKIVDRVDIVIASAGVTHPNYFDKLPVSEFQRLSHINYMGAVVTCKAASEHMKTIGGGRIVLVASMAGLAGIHGYSAYAPTKFAVRGLAECLAMELLPFNIYVSVCNPPDVDTPMYEEENKTKPKECVLISEGTGVFPAETLATDITNGVENYKFFIQTGFDGFMIGNLTAGFGPAGNFMEAFLQVVLMSPMRLVALVYRKMYNNIVLDVHKEKQKK